MKSEQVIDQLSEERLAIAARDSCRIRKLIVRKRLRGAAPFLYRNFDDSYRELDGTEFIEAFLWVLFSLAGAFLLSMTIVEGIRALVLR